MFAPFLSAAMRWFRGGPTERCASGTSAIRAYFGYNEPEMLLRHYVLGEEAKATPARSGYVFRYWNEVFLDDAGDKTVADGPIGRRGRVFAWP